MAAHATNNIFAVVAAMYSGSDAPPALSDLAGLVPLTALAVSIAGCIFAVSALRRAHPPAVAADPHLTNDHAFLS
jgi:hypothetical protein